jgi:hypothetical protein
MRKLKINTHYRMTTILALILSTNAMANSGIIGRCEQAAAIQVDVFANEMNERAMRNQGRATESVLRLVSDAIHRGEVTQMLSVYGEEGQAAICLSACAHGIGTLPSFELHLTPELQALKARLASLSRSGSAFATVQVRDIAKMRDCTHGE